MDKGATIVSEQLLTFWLLENCCSTNQHPSSDTNHVCGVVFNVTRSVERFLGSAHRKHRVYSSFGSLHLDFYRKWNKYVNISFLIGQ